MAATPECRRVLLVAGQPERGALRALLGAGHLPGWEVTEADSLEHARFILQMAWCDVLLLDAGLYRGGGPGALPWLTGQGRVPVLFLADRDPEVIQGALRHGAHQWLPRDLALGHPALIAAMLHQAARWAELHRRAGAAEATLLECERRVSRLLALLWEATPGEARGRWFTQRYMLERLEEEVARVRRYGGPLTVVLGEVRTPEPGRLTAEESEHLATWTARQIGRSTRRSDVAGRYGLQGFLMVLPRVTDGEAAGCCRRLRALLQQPPPAGTDPIPPLRVSFGVASYSPEASTVKSLLSRAEEALERAKAGPDGPAGGEPAGQAVG
jgi:diguanylate cyclase (GGDEF)-like protein